MAKKLLFIFIVFVPGNHTVRIYKMSGLEVLELTVLAADTSVTVCETVYVPIPPAGPVSWFTIYTRGATDGKAPPTIT